MYAPKYVNIHVSTGLQQAAAGYGCSRCTSIAPVQLTRGWLYKCLPMNLQPQHSQRSRISLTGAGTAQPDSKAQLCCHPVWIPPQHHQVHRTHLKMNGGGRAAEGWQVPSHDRLVTSPYYQPPAPILEMQDFEIGDDEIGDLWVNIPAGGGNAKRAYQKGRK